MTARPISLHQRILADISAKILSGEWPPGHRIPFESELTETYGCSRMTVNKAMSQLARSGLIERRKRSGSFVARPRSQAAVLEIHDIRTEVEALGLPYRYERLTRVTAPSAERPDRPFAPGVPTVELTCRHLAGRQPFCLERRIISLDAVPQAEAESFIEIAPGPWLLKHVPWSSAEHTIRALNADRTTAAGLEIAPGAACLVVERRTWIAEQPVTWVQLTYSGNAHAVTARFTPDQQ